MNSQTRCNPSIKTPSIRSVHFWANWSTPCCNTNSTILSLEACDINSLYSWHFSPQHLHKISPSQCNFSCHNTNQPEYLTFFSRHIEHSLPYFVLNTCSHTPYFIVIFAFLFVLPQRSCFFTPHYLLSPPWRGMFLVSLVFFWVLILVCYSNGLFKCFCLPSYLSSFARI